MTSVVPVSGLDPDQAGLFQRWAEVYAAAGRHHFGEDHSAFSADELRAIERATDRRQLGWAAVRDGAVLGSVRLVMPQRDNLGLGVIDLAVLPQHRGGGIGTLLLRQAERTAVGHGRTVLLAETERPEGSTDDGGEAFAAAHGFVHAQTVLRSTLGLPADGARLGAALAGDGTDGYVIETVSGGIPEGWLEGRAELSRRMSTDVPLGDLRLEEEVWDAERVREEYVRVEAMDRTPFDAFAVEEATGRLVGYTQILLPRTTPEVAFQLDTLVMREHRGHRLGLRLKAANAMALMAQAPHVTAVRTWNADDNAHMLAVNRALGFRTDAVMREWQKVTS